ncbi:hypothetical protein V8C86DRAFT_3006711 [Haematococcus lacustris]
MDDVAVYGAEFSAGFQAFRHSGDLSDVTVEVSFTSSDDAPAASPAQLRSTSPQPSCQFFALHSLLLANRSDFFSKALAWEEREGEARSSQACSADLGSGGAWRRQRRTLQLQLSAAVAPAWPWVLDYFYTDRVTLDSARVLPLLALARQLLISCLEGYCTDFLNARLDTDSCLRFLRVAVQQGLHDVAQRCAALAAAGLYRLWSCDLSGLPLATVLDILSHPLLAVHCEQQVLHLVLAYLASTHVSDPQGVRQLCEQVRFPFLDNATLHQLGCAAQRQPGAAGQAADQLLA